MHFLSVRESTTLDDREQPLRILLHYAVYLTRQLSYRKEDRAMRPI